MRWVGPETLVDVVLEGCEASALADSGSQVNMMMHWSSYKNEAIQFCH